MRKPLLMIHLFLIAALTGCAVNPPLSGPQALKLEPAQPAQTGTTNADQPSGSDLTNTF